MPTAEGIQEVNVGEGSNAVSEDRPELDPDIPQNEDGIVIEPGSEIDRDLEAKLPADKDAAGPEGERGGRDPKG
jgi:hypothetical protein